MDSNQQSDHSNDEASAVALPQHITATSERDCPLPGTVPDGLAVRDDEVMQEELLLDEGAAVFFNESEDQQSRVLESVESGLGNVLFDVWCLTLLPLLSIPDIFQLCGVSRRLRELLHNEYTFKGLCQHRYQLSPYLEMSYIQIAKVMYIATRVASLHHSGTAEFMNCVIGSNDHRVFGHKMRSIVRLSSLALPLPENVVNTFPSCTSTGQLMLLAQEQCLLVEEACTYLPNISQTFIEETCNEEPGCIFYRLEDLVKLSFDNCSSIEQYQTAIIKDLEKDSSEMVQYLSSTNRSSRLVSIAKGFYSVARRDTTVVSLLNNEYLIAHLTPCLAKPWIYNPFHHFIMNFRNSDIASADAFASLKWIDATTLLATTHSVINLLITNNLQTNEVEDYFTAVLEYNTLWMSLPQSSRPRRDDLYRGLGTYIRGSSLESGLQRKLTKVDFLNAMKKYGDELVANAVSHA
ncbi:uncharacterized protein LOC135825155 [Sycon ciliatum]|uniref:uncharacterized protein LOC135825155 n=1 Tax=Sycon ciliatum TaxID=27933 RepID=UPI0031F62D2B